MMKKNEMAGLLIVVFLAFSGPVALAVPQESGPGQEKVFAEKKSARMQELYQKLNLTADQRKQLEENKTKNQEQMKTLFQGMREKMKALRDELQKDTLNMERVTQLNNELKTWQAKMSDHRLEGILAVRRILTPEQFKEFMTKMDESKERFRRKRGEEGPVPEH